MQKWSVITKPYALNGPIDNVLNIFFAECRQGTKIAFNLFTTVLQSDS